MCHKDSCRTHSYGILNLPTRIYIYVHMYIHACIVNYHGSFTLSIHVYYVHMYDLCLLSVLMCVPWPVV